MLASAYVWSLCSDGLPDSDTTVLTCNENWPSEPIWPGYHDGEGWFSVEGMRQNSPPDSGAPDAAPTHWMHLPEPPVKQGLKAIIVMQDDGGEKLTFKALFEPAAERADSAAWQMTLDIIKLVASKARPGTVEAETEG